MSFETFGLEHNLYIVGTLFIWVTVLFVSSKFLDTQQRHMMVIVLITLSLGQEIFDDILRWNEGVWYVANDLPLHMCGLSLITSTYALYTKSQTAFELSYFLGLGGALQAIVTPDPGRFPLDVSVFWNFLSHGIIIMNVLWLIFIENMRCRRGSFLNIILITNAGVFIISFLNSVLGGNYWFICQKPSGESPFIIGEWPLYFIGFEMFGIIVLGLFYIPMIILRRKGVQFAVR